jgi:hypothetical protein
MVDEGPSEISVLVAGGSWPPAESVYTSAGAMLVRRLDDNALVNVGFAPPELVGSAELGCAFVGGAHATDVAARALRRGVPVLLAAPPSVADALRLHRLARENDVTVTHLAPLRRMLATAVHRWADGGLGVVNRVTLQAPVSPLLPEEALLRTLQECVDALRCTTGAQLVDVTAISWDSGDLILRGVFCLRLPGQDERAFVSVDAVRRDPSRPTLERTTLYLNGSEQTAHVHMTGGGPAKSELLAPRRDPRPLLPLPPRQVDSPGLDIAEFVSACRSDGGFGTRFDNLPHPDDIVGAAQLADAMRQSARSERAKTVQLG